MYMYVDRSCNKASSIAIGPVSASLLVEALEFYILVSTLLGCDYEEGEKLAGMQSLSDAIKETC